MKSRKDNGWAVVKIILKLFSMKFFIVLLFTDQTVLFAKIKDAPSQNSAQQSLLTQCTIGQGPLKRTHSDLPT